MFNFLLGWVILNFVKNYNCSYCNLFAEWFYSKIKQQKLMFFTANNYTVNELKVKSMSRKKLYYDIKEQNYGN